MKLRNKKTGEIGKLHCDMNVSPAKYGVFEDTDIRGHYWEYHSLAELNKEWEDYEEPKKYYWIDYDGKVKSFIDLYGWQDKMKENGNYFETEEEAEKAIEKMKAWKRLEDKGFRFTAWYGGSKNISYEITSLENETYIPRQICDDLDLLFSGGEE